jgi:hypothetical protein
MRGANPENSRFAGSSEGTERGLFSADGVVTAASTRGFLVSERQLRRWREAKLLPLGIQKIELLPVLGPPGWASSSFCRPGRAMCR